MLDDYVNDLKTRLQERRNLFAAAVIANGDPVERGRVQGLDLAIGDTDELFRDYCRPDEGEASPKSLTVNVEKARRFGMRRAS